MNSFLDKIKNTKLLAGIGIICLCLGTFLGYVTFSFFGITKSISLFEYWQGKVLFLLAVVDFLFIFNELIQKFIPSLSNSDIGNKFINICNSKLSLIPIIATVIFAIYLHSNLHVITNFTNYSLGFYTLWLGIICIVVYSILHMKKNK